MASYLIKYLFGSFLAFGSLQATPDAEGWVSLERPDRLQEDWSEEEGEGVWVVFLKKMSQEKFRVRFPEDPDVQYFEGGVLLQAKKGEDHLFIKVEEKLDGDIESYFQRRIEEIVAFPGAFLIKVDRGEGAVLDLFYHSEGNWVWERIDARFSCLYSFRTQSSQMIGDQHRQMISSFEVFPL